MRVLHVIATGARRGGETFASDLMRALMELDLVQQVVILHGGQQHSLDLPFPAVVLDPEGPVDPPRRFDLRLLRSLRKLISETRPDVVQAHGGEALKYAVTTSLRPPPILYRRIGAVIPQLRRGPRRMAFSAQMRRAGRVVAVSEAVRRETIEVFGIPDSKIVTIPNAVDSARLQRSREEAVVRGELGVPGDALILTFLGAFTWEKDPLANLEIASHVLGAVPKAMFLMVGDGPLREDVEAIRRVQPLADRILLLGSRSDVGDLLAITDVLLSASKTEGMPANVIEAGMAGIAVAAYALSGIPEIIVDGKTGILAVPDDRAKLATGIITLLNNHKERLEMGRLARARCHDLFDIKVVAPQYLSVYREIATPCRVGTCSDGETKEI